MALGLLSLRLSLFPSSLGLNAALALRLFYLVCWAKEDLLH